MNKRNGLIIAALIAAAGMAKAGTNEVSHEAAEQLGAMVQTGIETFEWGLLVEAEGSYAKTGDAQASDLILATVEFTVDAAINDWLSGHVGLLWEEDDTEENILDEGFITLGGSEAFPVYAVAGRFYLPFGNFESVFVSDPLTLELAEINQSSLMVGYDHEWIGLSAGAFKGGLDEVIDDFYAAANITVSDVAEIGAYWLSDLMETASQFDVAEGLGIAEKIGGAGAYANVYVGAVTVNAEAVTGLDAYDGGERPLAYSVEASVGFAENWLAGIKYEGSEDLYSWDADDGAAVKYHGSGYGAVLSYGFNEHAALSGEYMRLEKLDNDDEGHLVTVQLAFEI